MNVPDQELIELMKMGDTQAFADLYARHWRSVYATAYYLLRDEAKAEDVAQEVFYHVFKNKKKIDPSQPILPYLKSATRNLCSNVQRANHARNKHEQGYSQNKDISIDPANNAEFKELQFSIAAAIKHAPPAARELFNLRFRDGWSIDEIAQEKAISAKTVRNQLSRTMKFVRSSIEKIWA